MIGMVNNCAIDFIAGRFGDDALARTLEEVGLPADAAFVSACPYADGVLTRCDDSCPEAARRICIWRI